MQTKAYSIEVSPDALARCAKYIILSAASFIVLYFLHVPNIFNSYWTYICGLIVPVILAGIDDWRLRRINRRKQLGVISASLFQRAEFLVQGLRIDPKCYLENKIAFADFFKLCENYLIDFPTELEFSKKFWNCQIAEARLPRLMGLFGNDGKINIDGAPLYLDQSWCLFNRAFNDFAQFVASKAGIKAEDAAECKLYNSLDEWIAANGATYQFIRSYVAKSIAHESIFQMKLSKKNNDGN